MERDSFDDPALILGYDVSDGPDYSAVSVGVRTPDGKVFLSTPRIFKSPFDLSDPKDPVQYELLKLEYAFLELRDAIVEAFAPIVQDLANVIKEFFNAICRSASPRVAYLAVHAKKARTRKKNQKRLFREIAALYRPPPARGRSVTRI